MAVNGFCDAPAVGVWILDWHVGGVDAHSDSAVEKDEFRHSGHVADAMSARKQTSRHARMSMSGSSSRSGRPGEAYCLDQDPEL